MLGFTPTYETRTYVKLQVKTVEYANVTKFSTKHRLKNRKYKNKMRCDMIFLSHSNMMLMSAGFEYNFTIETGRVTSEE